MILINQNLAGADFKKADLTNYTFENSDLAGADFRGAILTNANFKGADLTGALFDDSINSFAALIAIVGLKNIDPNTKWIDGITYGT